MGRGSRGLWAMFEPHGRLMEKIYITGRGLVTPLGVGLDANERALRAGKSGIVFVQDWKDKGLENQVGGLVDYAALDCPLFTQKNQRYMSPNSKMAVVAVHEAICEAGLSLDWLRGRRVAVVLGCGGGCYLQTYMGSKTLIETGKSKRISPFVVPITMPSSAVANISLILGLTGESYDISSACASGSHAAIIGQRLIKAGLYDMVITGGTEELNWVHSLGFDAMRATSRKYNATPEKASRPFDIGRDGFVIAEGAGILILESGSSMRARGGRPVVEISGVGANSNATDMVVPDAQAGMDVMRIALEDAGLKPEDIDYINTHGTSTPVGDPIEIETLRLLFGNCPRCPAINSTKSMTGHMIGATGAVEIIFTSQMIQKRFICPSINLDTPEPEFAWADLVRETRTDVTLRHAISNSFGFGGTNSTVAISAVDLGD